MTDKNQAAHRLIFGCHSLATLPTHWHVRRLINQAWELGIRSFDTAPLYSRGYSEALLGEILKSNLSARVTTKVGDYLHPKLIFPTRVALPSHWLMGRLRKLHHGPPTVPADSIPTDMSLSPGFFKSHINGSLQRLKTSSLDTILLHEVVPFDIQSQLENALSELLASGVARRIGYGGTVPFGWLDLPLPTWLGVLQLNLPVDDSRYLEKLEELILAYPNVEFRLFGLFRAGTGAPSIGKDLIHRYPNCRAVFSCRSKERLRANVEFLLN